MLALQLPPCFGNRLASRGAAPDQPQKSQSASSHPTVLESALPPLEPSPLAERAGPPAEQADQRTAESTLPLLRLSGWEPKKQYDKNNPECIHYDFRWKVSQRETSELGMFAQTQISTSSWLRATFGRSTSRPDLKPF